MCKPISIAAISMLLSLNAVSVAASKSASAPYAGQQQREIKSLSAKEIADLQAGKGMGLAKSAELNHYPGPRHVLDLSDKLKLSTDQVQQSQQLFNKMQQRAQAVGKKIIAAEKKLDMLFASGKAREKTLHAQLQSIAKLQGELRYTHLTAHLGQRNILTPQQVKLYDELRGYNNPHSAQHHHGGDHAH